MATAIKSNTIHSKQRGAVLVVSLLVLLVLTLIGVSSLDNSVLEEKMASNAQTSTITFQTAENAIRLAVLEESADPLGAVDKKRAGEAAVDRTANGITSSSQLVIIPNQNPPYCEGGSTSVRCPYVEIIGSANVGDIRSRNIQGFQITNAPHFE